MCKKILCVGALALGLVSLIGVALADNFGGGEPPVAAADSNNNVGSTDYHPGIYLGAQVGTAKMHYRGSEYLLAKNSYDDSYKLAARGYVGYAFSQFISAELGYDYYGRPRFKDKSGNTQEILQHGLDLVAKASLPLDYGFGLYVKAGAAFVYRSALNANNGTFAYKDSNNRLTPVGALGINYWFAPNIALDFGWTKTMAMSNLPTIDLFTAGFVYKINI